MEAKVKRRGKSSPALRVTASAMKTLHGAKPNKDADPGKPG